MAQSESTSLDVTAGSLAVATWRGVGMDGGFGETCRRPVTLDRAALRDLYRRMALGRRADLQASNLTRQGALGVYASSLGQEATEVGAVAALEPQDWLFPTYRDAVGVFSRGVDIVDILALFQGTWHCGYDPVRTRVAPLCTPLATQVVHATGLAMAARMRGDPVVALTFLGDGASSEGDTHEAMNMAGVYGAPCVFVVQNNGYAISVPLANQTRASSIALRAAGYGIAGARVDGNDILSVYTVVKEAVERARAGGGATLVETITYRINAHTTADDATRYRTESEVSEWTDRDPLGTYLAFLREHELVDDAFLASVESEGEAVAERMRGALYGAPAGDPLEMFDHVYAARTPQLDAQRAQLAAELAAEQEGAG